MYTLSTAYKASEKHSPKTGKRAMQNFTFGKKKSYKRMNIE